MQRCFQFFARSEVMRLQHLFDAAVKVLIMPWVWGRCRLSSQLTLDDGLENVFALDHRVAEGVRRAVQAWGLNLLAVDPKLYLRIGESGGKVVRIGHLGMLSDELALPRIATAEMYMTDLGLNVKLDSGVAAAQDYYRNNCATAA